MEKMNNIYRKNDTFLNANVRSIFFHLMCVLKQEMNKIYIHREKEIVFCDAIPRHIIIILLL